jgi:hypothetical protein
MGIGQLVTQEIRKMQQGMTALQTAVASLTTEVQNDVVVHLQGLDQQVGNQAAQIVALQGQMATLQSQLANTDVDADVQTQADLITQQVSALAATTAALKNTTAAQVAAVAPAAAAGQAAAPATAPDTAPASSGS